MLYKKAVLKNFAVLTGKQLCWSLFLLKLQAEKRLQHRCFPMHIANFLASILKNICERLLLIILILLLLMFFWLLWLFFYYIFVFGCLFTIDYDLYGEVCSLKLDIMQSNDVFFKGHVKIVKIYMVKFNVSVLHRLRITVFSNYKLYTWT